ncbi:hypothetical protein [Actinoplanes sp. CA-252034]|uniref:hypothetical protein n=1 Tax=Actinoplanes sp. CA-252034 TaxID=3239906 RepID=UPI003D983664
MAPSRRILLGGLGAAAAVTVAPLPAVAAPPPRLTTFVVEGSDASVALLPGATATVLLHVVRRFHYEIAPVGLGDVRPSRSGTALVVHPHRFPAGARGGLFPHELAVVRDILADCAGTVRWGGDDRDDPCEGLFRITTSPHDRVLARTAGRLGGTVTGSPPDPFSPVRRRAARDLADRQATGKDPW